MATLTSLASRLRAELGDLGRSFQQTFTGDGYTTRFNLSEAPLEGTSLVIKINGVNVSSTTTVEETTGLIILASAPADNAEILVSGTAFRYFTNDEINYYINTAFAEHTKSATDPNGATINVANLPFVDEYPVVILACSMALYTLATDAAFDIDIISPDGVSIPRSERFRQLMEMVQTKKEQYRELCNLLGTGLYRIEVFNLRRISRLTNKYVPMYVPQEIDDRSMPQRIVLPIPTYGDVTPPGPVPTADLSVYQGDSYAVTLDFPFNLTGYTFKAEIRQQLGGSVVLTSFNIAIDPLDNTKLNLSLTRQQTELLPRRSYWDLQAMSPTDTDYETTYLRGSVYVTKQVTV